MAREVNTVLGKIMAEQRGIPEAKAEEIVKAMRSANQYQVRYLYFPFLFFLFFLFFPFFFGEFLRGLVGK